MDSLNAKPNLLKQANLSSIRRTIKLKNTATRAEIADETQISTTTVRSLLTEMLNNKEIESIGYDESSGGRKAERYRLRSDRYYGAAFCITDNQIHGLLVDVYGEIIETIELDVKDGDFTAAVLSSLDSMTQSRDIKSIGIGVPGVVEGGGYWRQNEKGELYRDSIGDVISRTYGIPVFMENDLNATAIGFMRCYLQEFPDEKPEQTDMVYLHFEKGCISAGIISGGRVIRGCRNYAGEIGMIPMEDNNLLYESLSKPLDDTAYVSLAVRIICWLCGILNPQYIALGGPAFRKDCIAPISDTLFSLLPKAMLTEILYAPDMWQDYHDGMAHLTAGKIFEEIQFIKE